jgi:hypothetical protein
MIQESNNDTYNNGQLQEATVQRRQCESGIKQTHSLGINDTSNILNVCHPEVFNTYIKYKSIKFLQGHNINIGKISLTKRNITA